MRNVPQIIASGAVLSDARRLELGLDSEIVGMDRIKKRRLEGLEVNCHPGTKVGQYVPFYFCPRSIMLYILHKANHPDLSYRGGQRPILHLKADLTRAIAWANANGVRWAFSNRNAGAHTTDFFSSLDELNEVNWQAVAADQWSDPDVREGKQAEFLVFDAFPWELIERVGVIDVAARAQVETTLRSAAHKPLVSVERGWYY